MSLSIDSDDEKLDKVSSEPELSLGSLSPSGSAPNLDLFGRDFPDAAKLYLQSPSHVSLYSLGPRGSNGASASPQTPPTVARMSQQVTLNVSGTRYEVSRTTLAMHPRTMLGRLASHEWHKPDQTEIFIDRDPQRFRYILDWYRDHEIHIPLTMSKDEIMKDVRFFCLPLTENDIFFKTCNVQDLCAVKEAADEQFQKTYDKLKNDADIALARSTALNTIAHLLKKAYQEPHVSSFEVSPRKFSPKCKFYNTKFWTIFEKFALDLAKDAGFECQFPNTYDGMVCTVSRISPKKSKEPTTSATAHNFPSFI